MVTRKILVINKKLSHIDYVLNTCRWKRGASCQSIGLAGILFINGSGDQGLIPGRVILKTQKKWYLMPPCLTLGIIR